jgi:hypothetical protein
VSQSAFVSRTQDDAGVPGWPLMLPASGVRIGTNGRQVSFSPARHFGAAGIILNGRPGRFDSRAILCALP